ncbi:TPA: hypothetical protein OL716_004915 [Enterobacter cloacae]|nr:hypothetical protein [Enterobacter cloacae]
MDNILGWTVFVLKATFYTVVLCGISYTILTYTSLPVALGVVSLSMTILPGTDFVKEKIQYINSPNGKADIWGAASIALSIIAVIYGVFTDQIKGNDTIAYLVTLAILIVIMLISAFTKKAP